MSSMKLSADEAAREPADARAAQPREQRGAVVFSVDLGPPGPGHPFSRETFSRRDDATKFIDEVRGDDPKLACLLIEKHGLEAAC